MFCLQVCKGSMCVQCLGVEAACVCMPVEAGRVKNRTPSICF